MHIQIPELAVIAVIGDETDLIKSFLKKYFKQEEIFNIKQEKFIEARLKVGGLAATYLPSKEEKGYKMLVELSKKQHVLLVGIVLVKQDAEVESETVSQWEEKLKKKGFGRIYVIDIQDKFQDLEVERMKLANNKRELHGPFDLIGDIHGCYDELCELLEKLGYEVDRGQHKATSKSRRIVVFCGDLVDRGPKVVDVLKLVMNMVKDGMAYTVLGNHDGKLQRKLHGANVKIIHGLEATLEQLGREPESFQMQVRDFLDQLVSHYVFDEGKLVVAHAGLKEKLHGRESKVIRDLAMFGETTGKLDEYGFPIRIDWSEHYKGRALVVYGHTPRAEAKMNNWTINIDTGCVYGGKLTAFRYPEQEIVDVEAKAVYYESIKPIQ